MAGEDVAVRDAVLRERVDQGQGDVVLADDVGEALGAVFAGENLVGHLSDRCCASTAIVVRFVVWIVGGGFRIV